MSIDNASRDRTRLRVVLTVLVIALAGTSMFAVALNSTRTDPTPIIDEEIIAADTRLADGGENEFIPADRDLSDCISAIPKPGCGSDARGGWRQTVVLLAILSAFAVIIWRIVVASRRARLERAARNGTT